MTLYIGVMSGTSADGIDTALVDINGDATIRLMAQRSSEIPQPIRDRIVNLYTSGENEIDRLGQLDVELAHLFSLSCMELLAECGLDASAIAAIGCHGQTIRHRPRLTTPFTLQIGNPSVIAETTGITTVADFRCRDMAAGGQGAPLAPAFHLAAFAETGKRRGILNLGGIANISILNGGELELGYDIGPANGLMDYWYSKHTQMPYDVNGTWAQSGSCQTALLSQLISHPYFELPPPKSTGREEFSGPWLEEHLIHSEFSPPDIQATLLELSSQTIAEELKRWALDEVYACGGGVHNQALMTRLQVLMGATPILTTDSLGIPADHVESMTFAWLAHRTLHQLPGNHPRVTGARTPCILGGIYWAG